MIRDLGVVNPGTTIYLPFHTFDSNDPSASVTNTGLAVTDIEVYKDGSMTQRASDNGYALLDTDGIDLDGITGIHGISIDLADNSTAGFWAAGSQYWVVISSITVDAATINFVLATFRIGQPGAILDTTIATLASQTSFTLTVGPAEDDALNGCIVRIHDVASAVQAGFAVVLDYTGSTKTVTLLAGTTFTAAATDNVSFFPPSNVSHINAVAASPVTTIKAVQGLAVDGVITTATNVTTVNGLAANVITAAATAADFGTEVGTAVWATTTRELTALDEDNTTIDLNATTIGTVTTLTNLPAITANWLTAAGTAADFSTEVNTAVLAVLGALNDAAADGAVTTTDTMVAYLKQIINTLEGAPGIPTWPAAAAPGNAVSIAEAVRHIYDQIGTAGVALTEAGGDGDHLTAINLPNQTMDIVGNITGNLSGTVGSVTGAVGSIATGGIAAASFAAGAIDAAAMNVTGSEFTAIPWNAAWDAEVQSEVDDAIAARFLDKLITVSGTADSGSTTTMVDAARTEGDNDYWKGSLILFTSGVISGQCRIITDFVAATDTFTFAPPLTQSVGTETYVILPGISVWDDTLAEHLISGSTGASLNAAGSAGDPWATALPGAYGAGTAGRLIGRSLPDIVAGSAGGLVIAGSNAATTFAGLTTGALACTTITASGAVAFQSTFAVTGTTTFTGAVTATDAGNSIVGVTVSAIGNNVITAASIAAGAIDAATFAADVDAEILSYIVDDATRIDASALNTASVTTIPAILVDTAEIGAAGAGLTAINLPNQTMDIVGNITGNLSGSVGSVTGAVGSVTAVVATTSNIKKNQALAAFPFLMTDSTTHAPATGKTVTVTRSINGAAFGAGTLSAVTEVANGLYTVDLGAGDLNGNVIVLRATATACDDTFERIVTVP